MKKQQYYIQPSQLCVGIYVHLDLSWMKHPFALSSFKIKNEAQITSILNMGLTRVRYDPARSDCEPLPLENDPAGQQRATEIRHSEPAEHLVVTAQIQKLDQTIKACEQDFIQATSATRQVLQLMENNPREAVAAADSLITGMVDSVLTNGDVIVQAMDGSRLGEETYSHALNVTVMSLMMAKSLDLARDDARQLGMAALFHDVGKARLPENIRKGGRHLDMVERALFQQHCEFGANMVREGGASWRLSQIIMQHHEMVDGSGYPLGLSGDAIDPLARILSMVGAYENLCNPFNPADAMTPYGALSYLFSNKRRKFDSLVLNQFIKSLGVYPPGSIVLLNDGVYGVVVSVNPSKLLRPCVMVHDRRFERDTPNIIDLGKDMNTSISKCVRNDQVPPEVVEYLQCRQRQSYFYRKEHKNTDDEAITS